MFSLANSCNLVFVNDGDKYYENCLEMDRKHYLWWKLHEEGFDKVYFLSEKQGSFEVSTLGDKDAEIPKKLWKPIFKDPFSKVIESGLLKNFVLVCRIEDFCNVLDCKKGQYESTTGTLVRKCNSNEISLILVVTPGKEKYFGEAVLLRRICKQLPEKTEFSGKSGKEIRDEFRCANRRDCVFLDRISEDVVRKIIRKVLLEDPEKAKDYKNLTQIAEYLAMALDPESDLSDEAVAREAANASQLYSYLSRLKCGEPTQFEDKEKFWNYLIEKCRRTDLNCLRTSNFETSGSREHIANICKYLDDERMEEPNLHIKACARRFMKKLIRAKKDNDLSTCECILWAIEFCLHRCIRERDGQSEENILAVIAMFRTYIEFSKVCFEQSENIKRLEKVTGSLAKSVLDQEQINLENNQRILEIYKTLVQINILHLNDQISQVHFDEMTAKLNGDLAILGGLTENPAENSGPETEAQPETEELPEMTPEEIELLMMKM